MELSKCPECGYSQIKLIQIDYEDREGTPKALQCMDCGFMAEWGYHPSEIDYIINNWNKGVEYGSERY